MRVTDCREGSRWENRRVRLPLFTLTDTLRKSDLPMPLASKGMEGVARACSVGYISIYLDQ